MRTVEETGLPEHLLNAAAAQGQLQQLDDHREAIDAIVEKRAPQFKGQ